MTNFDLPPMSGFDPMQKPRFLERLADGGVDALRGRQGPVPGEGEGAEGAAGTGDSFASALTRSLAGVDSLQDEVKAKTRGLVLGEDVEVHDVLIASAKSEVAFNLMIEVRNKLVDAWEKLSRSAV
jgi:flagellar hook-basal body complex protein FliE